VQWLICLVFEEDIGSRRVFGDEFDFELSSRYRIKHVDGDWLGWLRCKRADEKQ
jgi:hypothetical protein